MPNEVRILSGDEVLTQIGLKRRIPRKGFRCKPRAQESALSLLLGRWDVDWAVRTAFGRDAAGEDMVRHTTATRIAEAGFRVILDKDPYPAHVSVEFDGQWTDEVCERFHRCFETAKEGGRGG
jgi:hypothetical protein